MSTFERWLLPAGIEESLPDEARQLETIRRMLLDCYASWGYQLVIPPFIEYLDSLQVSASQDLNIKTFKLTDQLSGRTLGIRADITPQVARIDAHMLKHEGPERLSYVGTVLWTLPETLGGTRSPLQIGAELYGHAGLESDLEIARLMLQTAHIIGLQDIVFDIGHVGIFKALVSLANLSSSEEKQLFMLLQRKSSEEVKALCNSLNVEQPLCDAIYTLSQLYGSIDIIERARRELAPLDSSIANCIQYIDQFVQSITPFLGEARLHFDLAELPGYQYENGILFTLYTSGESQPVARGGRYDGIGLHFGRDRPATGFSADLKLLTRLGHVHTTQSAQRIYAPVGTDLETISKARAAGQVVISELPDQTEGARPHGCTHEFVNEKNTWKIRKLEK